MRNFLFSILVLIGLLSIVVSFALMAIPDGSVVGLNVKLLKDSHWRDFQVPGLILFIAIGLPSILAIYFNLIKHDKRYHWALLCGILLALWSIIQGIYAAELFWVNSIMLVLAMIVLLVSFQLKGKMLL